MARWQPERRLPNRSAAGAGNWRRQFQRYCGNRLWSVCRPLARFLNRLGQAEMVSWTIQYLVYVLSRIVPRTHGRAPTHIFLTIHTCARYAYLVNALLLNPYSASLLRAFLPSKVSSPHSLHKSSNSKPISSTTSMISSRLN